MVEQYDRIAVDYVQSKKQFFSNNPDFAQQFICAHLTDPTGKRLLDVGCGVGDEITTYKQMGFSVYGIDPSACMVEQARQKVAQPENVKVGSYEKTGLTDEHFDYIVGRFSLHYLEDIDTGYKELSRILKPDALLIMVVAHPFADSLEKNRTQINDRDYITITIYGSVEITYPLHALSEYLSPTFLKLFNLIDLQKHIDEDTHISHVPNTLGFAGRKKVA